MLYLSLELVKLKLHALETDMLRFPCDYPLTESARSQGDEKQILSGVHEFLER